MANYDFALPSLGADMEQATLLEWQIAPGDSVSRGDIVAIIDTEKSEIDLEIWHGGTVVRLLVEEGQEVPVGAILAQLSGVVDLPRGDRAPAAQPPTRQPQALELAPTTSSLNEPRVLRPRVKRPPQVHSPLVRHLAISGEIDLTSIAGTGPGGSITRHDIETALANQDIARVEEPAASETTVPERAKEDTTSGAVPASPLARRLASEQQIDLGGITGSGPGGAVLSADLTAPATSPGQASGPSTTPLASSSPTPPPKLPSKALKMAARNQAMRHAVASLMARSKKEIPHYYLAQDINLELASKWLEATNGEIPPSERILSAALLLKASALAAKKHPKLNGFWVEDHFEPSEDVHLGVAVSLRGGGLVAPAILDASTKPLTQVMAELRDLVSRTRSGRLRGAEMSSPTLTVSSLGDRGPDLVHGIIYPPQVALIGFGRVTDQVVVVGGQPAVQSMITATLSGDHRATDGDRGARFLATLAQLLQKPEEL